ncbi:hypothetical protein [Nocardia veterana]|uniref:Uncharacterized protein n=1 Tax=Nocardia veterana TaxID=132249 RepID=A0A7X6RI54_9NOCA|nr:hypothetical protein [Nocardia veterana]NKY86811.1 hypothetical protein [Nocardia veterana]
MSDAEQIGFDIDFDDHTRAWLDWVAPEHRRQQAERFAEYVGLPGIPESPWPEGAPEIDQLSEATARLFPDMETAMSRDRFEAADQFICFLGECFIKFAGAQWFEYTYFGREYSFYEQINPALRYGIDEDSDTAWGLVSTVVEYGFPEVAAQMRDYAARYERRQTGS